MQLLRPLDRDLWWRVVRAAPEATFFHTPLWSRIVCAGYTHLRDGSLGARLPSGTTAVLPLVEGRRVARGLLRSLESTFEGCYGGIVADGPVRAEESAALYRAALRWRVGTAIVSASPFAPDPALGRPPFGAPRADSTHALALDEGFDALLAGFTKGHRSSFRKGLASGVTVRLAEDEADVSAYGEAYEEARARWGAAATTDHPPELFGAAWSAAREHPELVRLWLAEAEGELAAGAWVFYWNDHAVWWHGAARERFSRCAPQNVLQVEILRDACARDFRWYDFNPSGGHAGVARFKSHFGARELPLEHWIWTSPKLKLFPRPRGRSRA